VDVETSRMQHGTTAGIPIARSCGVGWGRLEHDCACQDPYPWDRRTGSRNLAWQLPIHRPLTFNLQRCQEYTYALSDGVDMKGAVHTGRPKLLKSAGLDDIVVTRWSRDGHGDQWLRFLGKITVGHPTL